MQPLDALRFALQPDGSVLVETPDKYLVLVDADEWAQIVAATTVKPKPKAKEKS